MYDELKCCCNNEPYYISAYGLAVKRGYEGTLDEWLDSLGMYLHVAYADNLPEDGETVRSYPAGAYIGICATHSKEAPETAEAYAWTCVRTDANAEKIAPAWQAYTSYERDDIISYDGSVYSCRTKHTSGESFDRAKWLETTLGEALVALGIKASVNYTAQDLTEAQKLQARTNIGAMKDGAGIVTAEKIANGAVVGDKIAPTAVGTAKIADGAVITEKLAGGAVTAEKLADGAVSGNKLADGTVTAAKLAAGAVSGSKLNLSNGDLPMVTLVPGVHYVNSVEELPSSADIGRIVFVKRG